MTSISRKNIYFTCGKPLFLNCMCKQKEIEIRVNVSTYLNVVIEKKNFQNLNI